MFLLNFLFCLIYVFWLPLILTTMHQALQVLINQAINIRLLM